MAASVCNGTHPAALPMLRWVLLASVLSGCGSARTVYIVQPMPVVVRPLAEPWDVEVALNLAEAIHLQVINAGDEPVKLLWADCTYIDMDGRAHPLVMAKPAGGAAAGGLLPMSIAPGSRLEQVLVPAAGQFNNRNDPLLPGRSSPTRPRGLMSRLWPFHRDRGPHPAVGKTIGVFLVLERNGSRRTVTANYTITGVHPK